jgi:hypothetical protein
MPVLKCHAPSRTGNEQGGPRRPRTAELANGGAFPSRTLSLPPAGVRSGRQSPEFPRSTVRILRSGTPSRDACYADRYRPLSHRRAPPHLALPISSLNPDPANARTHDEKNLASIRGSLARFGQRFPLVVQNQGMVVRAGNGRLLAAKELGWTHMAALVVDESAVEATAFAIADNRSAELAEWDDQSLAQLLQSLPDDAFAATGCDDSDLKKLLDRLAPAEVA